MQTNSTDNPAKIRTRGRPKSPYVIRAVKLAFKDEAEYQQYLKGSDTRLRVAAVLRAIETLDPLS